MAKTALVTGAAVGIGRTVSLRLAREGMSVGVLDLNFEGCEAVVAEIKAAGGKAIALKASVSDRAQMTAAIQKLRDTFGPITVLVNNAGIVDFKPFLQITDDEWDRMYAVNVKGTFIATQIIVPDMQAAKWGRIINISSSSAQTGSKTLAHYSSSKGAIITLTRSLAQELGPDGITVNNVPPGSVMQTQMSEANKERFPNSVDSMLKIIPVRRMGEPNDIASAVSFLASEDSSYITGQTLGVNGGRVVS